MPLPKQMIDEIVDLNHDLTSPEWRLLEKVDRFPMLGWVEGMARYIYILFRSLLKRRAKTANSNVVFFVGSHNHIKSILPVQRLVPNSTVFCYHDINNEFRDQMHKAAVYLSSIKKIFLLISFYKSLEDPYIKWTVRKRLDRYLVSFVLKDYYKILLTSIGAKVAVVSNDHNCWSRSLLKACNELEVFSIFIPHAPTGKNPARPLFDLALLDGETQKKQYSDEGQINIVTGAIRYERIVQNVEQGKGRYILVCFNPLDKLGDVEKVLCRMLLAGIDRRDLLVRPHPADKRLALEISKLCVRKGIRYNDPTSDIKDALTVSKAVFAGVSGVHVDALMSGKPIYSFSDWYGHDYYGLVSAGYLTVFDDCFELSELEEVIDVTNRSYVDLNWHLANRLMIPSEIAAEWIKVISSFQPASREHIKTTMCSRLGERFI